MRACRRRLYPRGAPLRLRRRCDACCRLGLPWLHSCSTALPRQSSSLDSHCSMKRPRSRLLERSRSEKCHFAKRHLQRLLFPLNSNGLGSCRFAGSFPGAFRRRWNCRRWSRFLPNRSLKNSAPALRPHPVSSHSTMSASSRSSRRSNSIPRLDSMPTTSLNSETRPNSSSTAPTDRFRSDCCWSAP